MPNYLDCCRRLAVLGGTFDPIHMGHLSMAEAVLARFSPQRVLFVPCGQPPHKDGVEVSAAEHRYQMALLATCEHPFFDVSPMEIERNGTSFTIDTARQLVQTCSADAQIYFVIGADSLLALETWKDAHELLRLVYFIAVPRPGYSKTKAAKYAKELNARHGKRVFMLDADEVDISGTEIRRRFSKGKSVRTLVPRAVEDYARAHNLYNLPISFASAKAELKKRLSQWRFDHTMGVVDTAKKLARKHGANVEKARWAALLHDCAKEYSTDKKLALCKKWGIATDGSSPTQLDLAHGAMSAESARRDFYVTDTEILQAIRHHTTGHGGLTLLDKIIMLADAIEPNRENVPHLHVIRALAFTDLDKALLINLKDRVKWEARAGNVIHPGTFDALETLKKDEKNDKR